MLLPLPEQSLTKGRVDFFSNDFSVAIQQRGYFLGGHNLHHALAQAVLMI